MPTVRLTGASDPWVVPANVSSIDLSWSCALWQIWTTSEVSDGVIRTGGSTTESGSRSNQAVSEGNAVAILHAGDGCYLDITYAFDFRTGSATFEAGSPALSATATKVKTARAELAAGSPSIAAAGTARSGHRATFEAGSPSFSVTVTRRGAIEFEAGPPALRFTFTRRASATFEAGAPQLSAIGSKIRRASATFEAGSPTIEVTGDARTISFARAIRATSPEHVLLTAIELRHPDVAAPLRLVAATEDKTIEGNVYTATAFQPRLASDKENQAPRAEIAIGNIGREATRWIERANGGTGATARVMQLLDGGSIEWETTLDVERIADDSDRLVARLGFNPGRGRPAVAKRHDPRTTPGIF